MSPKSGLGPDLPRLSRRRPRSYEEWSALRRWGRLPDEEEDVVGFLLRVLREETGLSQAQLAERLGCSQQAVSQAERWESNPTVRFIQSWAEALDRELRLEFADRRSPSESRGSVSTSRSPAALSSIHVVGAAIVERDRCLVARRSSSMSLPLKWEFPGGKVEPDEEPSEALVREIREELGVEIRVGERIGTGTAEAGTKRVVLDVYAAELLSGDIVLAEHSDFGWFGVDELRELDWAEADVPVLPALYALLGSRAVEDGDA